MTNKKMKLVVSSIITLVFAVVFFTGMNVNAKTITDKDVKIDFHSTDDIRMIVKKSSGAAGVQVELKNSAKKTVATKTVKSGNVSFNDLSPASVYYYRVREYTLKSNIKRWSAWSKLSAFSTCYADFKATKNLYSAWIQTPKSDSVVKYEIWMSASGMGSGFSKIGTVNAGKTVYMSKFRGKPFQSYGNNHVFYVFLKPILKSGSTRGYYSKTAFSFDKGKLEQVIVSID